LNRSEKKLAEISAAESAAKGGLGPASIVVETISGSGQRGIMPTILSVSLILADNAIIASRALFMNYK
jgi:hypothetical protein